MDGGAWWATVHGVAKSQTRLGDFTFTFSTVFTILILSTHITVSTTLIVPTFVSVSLIAQLVNKESACNEGDPSLVSGSGRSTEEGIGHSLQHSGLEKPWAIQSMGLQRVGNDRATFTFHFVLKSCIDDSILLLCKQR